MMRILTRGLTGEAGAIIVQGLGPVALELVRIVRGGRSAASRAIKDLTENFKISAMLIQVNGKELVNPIINNIRKTFNEGVRIGVKVFPQKLVSRQSSDVSVTIENIKVRNNKNDNN